MLLSTVKRSIPAALTTAVLVCVLAGGCDSSPRTQAARPAGTPAPPVKVQRSPSQTKTAPSISPLAPPVVDGAGTVLAKNSGSGTMSRPQTFATDGSYMFYATCALGTKLFVVTSGKSKTPVPCSGYTSRMRFIATGTNGLYQIVADSGTEWAITWTDYEPER